jgi:tetratricopeptide (TPR) repeat protein
LESGWRAVEKAKSAGKASQRERGYVDAAAAFYQGGANRSFEDRSAAYLRAMEKLSIEHPDDHEAAAFYALALIGSPHANDNDLAYRRKGVAILGKLFEDEPEHPGLAHYLIHTCDNPRMAKDGLIAARRYAQIAPASSHALHMPSHIFTRMGLWDDDIKSNLASKAAAEKLGERGHRLHAMDFLLYAYLQTGQTGKAKAMVAEALSVPADKSERAHYSDDWVKVHFQSLLELETRNWQAAASLQAPEGASAEVRAIAEWTHAIALGHLRDAPQARAATKRFDQALEAVKSGPNAYIAQELKRPGEQVQAWAAFAEGRADEAVEILTSVADEQDRVGKGEVAIPAREMLADVLLDSHRPADALAQYTKSLTNDPNRFNALFGAGRAAELAGEREIATKFYKQLLQNCSGAAERPEIEMAKR